MGEGRRSVSLVLFLSSPLSYLFCSPSPSLFLPFLHLCLSIIPLPLFLHPPLLSIPPIPHFLHLLKSSFILPPSSSSLPPLPRFPFFFNSFSSSVLSLHHLPLFLSPLSSSLPSLLHFPLFFPPSPHFTQPYYSRRKFSLPKIIAKKASLPSPVSLHEVKQELQ